MIPSKQADDLCRCPNCDNLIDSDIEVCPACGINIQAYLRNKENINNLRSQTLINGNSNLNNIKKLATGHSKKKQAFMLLRQNPWFVGALLVTLIIFVLLAASRNILETRRSRARDYYQESIACQLVGDYECAYKNILVAEKLGLDGETINTNLVWCYENYASSLYQQGRFSESFEYANKCLELKFDNNLCENVFCSTSRIIIRKLIIQQKLEDAIEIIDMAVVQCPNPETLLWQQKLLYHQWNIDSFRNYEIFTLWRIRKEWNEKFPGESIWAKDTD